MIKLKERYKKEMIPALIKEFGYENPMQAPKLEKIIINRGVGEAVINAKVFDKVSEELSLIAGQKPLVRTAKKSIAGFKVRKGVPIGCKVTLRGDRMYEFMDKLTNICLPRIRDFRGLNPKSFDGRGNYSLGIKEQLIFPEVDYDKVDKIRGMDITIVTTAKKDEEAKKLLMLIGVPFAK